MGKKKAKKKARAKSAKKGRESGARMKQSRGRTVTLVREDLDDLESPSGKTRKVQVTGEASDIAKLVGAVPEATQARARKGTEPVAVTVEQMMGDDRWKRKVIRDAYAEIEWWRQSYGSLLRRFGDKDALTILEAIEAVKKKKGKRWPKPKAPET